VLAPTRELALQIESSLRTYGRHMPLRSSVVLGGVSMYGQIRSLRTRPDILVATPGRLLDLVRQNHVRLDQVELLVLDEADRMLDMGFIHDVRTIIGHIKTRRQTMLFSATLSPEIAKLASEILDNPVSIATTPAATLAPKIEERVLFVDRSDKGSLLVDLLKAEDVRRALVFTRTKHRADRVARQLSGNGIGAAAIHSNKSQNQRQRSLADFEQGRVRVLVATDIVARGIHVDGISHVVNFELPSDPESYVHRVGRTARAGAGGIAVSLCDAEEVELLRGIEKLIRHKLPAGEIHKFHSAAAGSLRDQRPHTFAAPRRGPSAGRRFARPARRAAR
jgi:ATP-dependent RNA helicase RhlE